jgi:prolipoprotein diacylglyceryltransferase
MLWILDRIVAPIAIAACFIRLGNLMNQEIVGVPTTLPWGFRFSELAFQQEYLVDDKNVFRHPTQIYEAGMYLLTFFILLRMYWKTTAKEKPGKLFGAFMILVWSARFLIEFVKEGQSEFDEHAFLNTGQLLSIPFILIGVYLIVKANKQQAIN